MISIKNIIFVSFLNISFLLAGWYMLKKIDRRPPAFLGFNFWTEGFKEYFLGAGIGLANFGLIFLTLLAFGCISSKWVGFESIDVRFLSLSLLSFLVFASIEELINRGYIFQTLCEGIGVWKAAIITSLVFSIVHFPNQNFTVLGGIFLFVHGLLYAFAYIKTRSLWTPIGLHMAWNFAQGPIAGINVSGGTIERSFFSTSISGPDVLTGGNFGAEGGMVAILISIIVLLVILKANWLRPSARYARIEDEWKNKSRGQSK